jgi:hypothetical protein
MADLLQLPAIFYKKYNARLLILALLSVTGA